MVLNQFRSTLQKQGVTAIESLEKVFDPNLHEAVGQEPSTLPSGTITQEHMRGYTLHGRLLRPARVIISNGQEAEKVS
jgi:molecular chaperone GrpE